MKRGSLYWYGLVSLQISNVKFELNVQIVIGTLRFYTDLHGNVRAVFFSNSFLCPAIKQFTPEPIFREILAKLGKLSHTISLNLSKSGK